MFGKEFSSKVNTDTTKICPYCGNVIDALTVEHLIPRAVEKWFPLKSHSNSIINAKCNRVECCYDCNYSKSARIESKDELLKYVSDKMKKDFSKLYDELKPSIDDYILLKDMLYKDQRHRCKECHKLFTIDNLSIRRIDNHKPRDIDNAELVCEKCNRHLHR